MCFTASLPCSSPPFAKFQQQLQRTRRRKAITNTTLFSSSLDFLLSISPLQHKTRRKQSHASPAFAPTSSPSPFTFAFYKSCHLLFSGAFLLSSLHLNVNVAYASHKLTPLIKYPCEQISTYYQDLEGLQGLHLAKRLNSIVSPHLSLSYKQVWEALKVLDAADIDHPEISSEVIEIYTQKAVSKQLAGKPEGWNREHLWPKSYGLQKGPARTDLHNIRPADVNVNSARGNKYYGECNAAPARCLRPATREAAPDTEADSEKWAPPFQVRGDIARSLMYMAVCYGFTEPDGSPYLQLSNSPSLRWHEMGLLSSLLKWNELDPPSKSEKLRNDRVCKKYQHNRNPFIDHPEYADMIWGHLSPSNSDLFHSIANDARIEHQTYNKMNSEK